MKNNMLSKYIFNGRNAVIAVPYLWLLILFLFPFLIVLKISFAEPIIAIPPFSSFFHWDGSFWPTIQASFYNYVFILEDSLYLNAYLSSLKIALISTLITLVIGYAIAYSITKAPTRWKGLLLLMVILPFWTSFLIRVYAWIGILKTEGLLNLMLLSLGITDQPLTIMNTNLAVYIGIVYSYLPFMILPIYANIEKMDGSLIEAAADLGCRPFKTFWKITIPLSIPGILAGCFLVFIPAVGEFVIPDLLGGTETLMIGKVLWIEFFSNRDWPLASAVAVILLAMLILPIMYYQKSQEKAIS
ncbi:MAG TPA: ABC transporter permease subunit [Candidatus Thioglobus sp.]|jgi:putrescine transport system permease protein|nr:ABC transporter permease subunit [Candidatus Thioglobus sp.]HIL42237.1 ABC transporter permease subunit [Gammaproteobacteria bacterium]